MSPEDVGDPRDFYFLISFLIVILHFTVTFLNTTVVLILVLLVQSFLDTYTNLKVPICIWTGASTHSQIVFHVYQLRPFYNQHIMYIILF